MLHSRRLKDTQGFRVQQKHLFSSFFFFSPQKLGILDLASSHHGKQTW